MFIDLPALRHKLRKVEAPYSVYNDFKSKRSAKIIIKTRVTEIGMTPTIFMTL